MIYIKRIGSTIQRAQPYEVAMVVVTLLHDGGICDCHQSDPNTYYQKSKLKVCT